MTTDKVMTQRLPKSKPTWKDVKTRLATFDQTGLTALIQDLYSASRDNQTFLHTRFGLNGDALAPYKKIIDRWIAPDVLSASQRISISKAKQAVTDYKKASGDPEGLAELMVFYCERAADFCVSYGNDDEGYFDALIGMFEQSLKTAGTLPEEKRKALFQRLQDVQEICDVGYGVRDFMADLLAEHGSDAE